MLNYSFTLAAKSRSARTRAHTHTHTSTRTSAGTGAQVLILSRARVPGRLRISRRRQCVHIHFVSEQWHISAAAAADILMLSAQIHIPFRQIKEPAIFRNSFALDKTHSSALGAAPNPKPTFGSDVSEYFLKRFRCTQKFPDNSNSFEQLYRYYIITYRTNLCTFDRTRSVSFISTISALF